LAQKAVIVGTTPTKYLAEAERTVLIIQNMDTTLTDYIYFGHDYNVAVHGIRISGQGGSLTLRKSMGEEPEKAFYLVATTASTPVRLTSLYGKVEKVEVEVTYPETPPPGQMPPSDGGGPTPGAPSCIASAVIPFTPVLNIFRHIRSYLPRTAVKFYYQIPYPKKGFWGWLQ
jgi:hypothetical protein